MKRMWDGLAGCAFLFLIAVPLDAQSGCTDSPENSTVVLAIVGGVGMVSAWGQGLGRGGKRLPEAVPALAGWANVWCRAADARERVAVGGGE
jgi:XrtJ-associated TM-motif-TM protein